jgi:hypothetical protein
MGILSTRNHEEVSGKIVKTFKEFST